MASPRRPQLVYDSTCELCTRSARWISRDAAGLDTVPSAALDERQLESLGLLREQTLRSLWWIATDGTVRDGHEAIAAALATGSGWRRRTGRVLGTPPLAWLAAPLYRLVARNRHRISARLFEP